jgi:hypothetical protein
MIKNFSSQIKGHGQNVSMILIYLSNEQEKTFY